ncbi:hypothetical protein BKA70DRAFT_1131885 [Coprinopsis sp. MPI-PUGE-AT-0042]|nr:hypothetical protein BKA70DRAFT_1131885 [Coprinopsis sp. MPI-PUGE-AT-0042]
MRELQSGNPRFHAYIGDNPAVFLSCIFSELCKLQSLSTIGLRQKLVQGKFHSQEWERFMAFLCMISGFRSLHANLARDSMHFVTRPLLKKEEQVNGTSFSGMFTGASAKSTNGIRTDNFSLDANAEVPIYDARYSADFDFMEDLVNIDRILPRWEGEIPYGSFVVVAYTIAVYRANNGHWTLSCNIQWAMIVGIADEEDST